MATYELSEGGMTVGVATEEVALVLLHHTLVASGESKTLPHILVERSAVEDMNAAVLILWDASSQ